MITVYGFPNTRSTRITWILEELGQEWNFHLVDFNKGDSRSPEYLAINPAGKVPAAKIDDHLMTESAAIVSHLCDLYSGAGLIPAVGTTARAEYEQWSYFALCELEQPLWTMGKHKFALPPAQRIPEIMETAAWEFQRALELLSAGLADKPYILGKNFSGADVLLAHTLMWGISFKQPIEQQNLRGYIDRCKTRPALLSAKQKEAAE